MTVLLQKCLSFVNIILSMDSIIKNINVNNNTNIGRTVLIFDQRSSLLIAVVCLYQARWTNLFTY